MIESILARSLLDPEVQGTLPVGERAAPVGSDVVRRAAAKPAGRALVTVSPAMNIQDVRIALTIAQFADHGIVTQLLLRDHHAAANSGKAIPFIEGRARFLDLLSSIGVPEGAVETRLWSDVAAKLALDADFWGYLRALPTSRFHEATRQGGLTDFASAYTTMVDVFLAYHPDHLPSEWMIGGPTRLALQTAGIEAMESPDYRGARSATRPAVLPLPALSRMSSLEGVVAADLPTPDRIERDLVAAGPRGRQLLEICVVEPLASRTGVQLGGMALAAKLSATLQSLDNRKARAASSLSLGDAETDVALIALGDPIRLAAMRILMKTPNPLTVDGVHAKLPNQGSVDTTRRALKRLVEAGLALEESRYRVLVYKATARGLNLTIRPS